MGIGHCHNAHLLGGEVVEAAAAFFFFEPHAAFEPPLGEHLAELVALASFEGSLGGECKGEKKDECLHALFYHPASNSGEC